MTPIVLTPHQTEAVQFLTDHLHDGDPIVALRGLAGTGKTSLIPALINVLEGTGLSVALGAPTHRAAMVLKKKGLAQADTVHALALTPYFQGDYARCMQWLGQPCPCKNDELLAAHEAVDGVPWLIAERLRKLTGMSPQTIKTRASQYDPKKALESIGIYGRNHFAGFGPRVGEGVLIIDEASMVGADMLKLCQEAFTQLCLIGDPGQLPPVKDAQVLATVPGFDLVEIHRQAADSPIVQLAYKARDGGRFWERLPKKEGELEEFSAVDARLFLQAPLIVWRNKTRIECTRAIREALGYPPGSPTVGEPLVCRTSDPRARADGFYNNAMFRVTGVSDHPRQVLVRPDGAEDGEEHEVLVHMEEVDGDNIDPEAILFRYGYCLTAHTAQGGEWPSVYISKPDLLAQAKRKVKEEDGDQDSLKQWSYTAITRAKVMLGLLNKHDFGETVPVARQQWAPLPPAPDPVPESKTGETMPRMSQKDQDPTPAPPSAPFLSMPTNEPDDIPDPAVPQGLADEAMASPVPGLPEALTAAVALQVPGMHGVATRHEALPEGFGAHEALLHGFCQYLQGKMHDWMRDEHRAVMNSMENIYADCRAYRDKVLEANEHALYALGNTLAKIQEDGVRVHGSPYEMSLQAYSPAGLPITLTIRQTSPQALIDELTRLEAWLAMNKYTARPALVETEEEIPF